MNALLVSQAIRLRCIAARRKHEARCLVLVGQTSAARSMYMKANWLMHRATELVSQSNI